MKRLLLLSAVAAASVVAAGAQAAATLLDFTAAAGSLEAFAPELDPGSNDSGKDFVVGGFQAYTFNNGISARSGPNGEDPSGHASATQPEEGWKIREQAVCLAVQGNLAAIGFEGTFNAFPEGYVYQEIVVVRDGGPGGALDGFDAYGGDPRECGAFLPFAAASQPLERGNVLVHDAP